MGEIKELGNITNLLETIRIGNDSDISITTDNINTYIFLLSSRDINFTYPFIFKPMPYSNNLLEDIIGLNYAHYLSVSSPIYVKDKGINYLQRRDISEEHSEKIQNNLIEFSRLDKVQLFEIVYTTLCR